MKKEETVMGHFQVIEEKAEELGKLIDEQDDLMSQFPFLDFTSQTNSN